MQKIRKLLATSGRVLANTVDENRRRLLPRLLCIILLPTQLHPLLYSHAPESSDTAACHRSGLHFVAATGNAACARLFCKAGADLNLCDKDGAWTPSCMHPCRSSCLGLLLCTVSRMGTGPCALLREQTLACMNEDEHSMSITLTSHWVSSH